MLTLVEKLLLLADVPLFSRTRTSDLAHLAPLAREEQLRQGDVLHAAGDAADALIVVAAGRLLLVDGERRAEVGSGGSLGGFALLEPRPRQFTATAMESTVIVRLDRDAFTDSMSDHVNVARGVLHELARRVREGIVRSPGQPGPDELELG